MPSEMNFLEKELIKIGESLATDFPEAEDVKLMCDSIGNWSLTITLDTKEIDCDCKHGEFNLGLFAWPDFYETASLETAQEVYVQVFKHFAKEEQTV